MDPTKREIEITITLTDLKYWETNWDDPIAVYEELFILRQQIIDALVDRVGLDRRAITITAELDQ